MKYAIWHIDTMALAGGTVRLPQESLADIAMIMAGIGSQAKLSFSAGALLSQGLYKRVAVVEAEGLEEAYAMTNHIDGPWQANGGVVYASSPARSSSPGDLFADEEGNVFMCAAMGFKQVAREKSLALMCRGELEIPAPGEACRHKAGGAGF